MSLPQSHFQKSEIAWPTFGTRAFFTSIPQSHSKKSEISRACVVVM
jgi:hypothetical protein